MIVSEAGIRKDAAQTRRFLQRFKAIDTRGFSEQEQVNKALMDAPEGINDDPHEKGWMVEIQMSSPAEANDLLSSKQYEELLAAEH